MTEPEPLYRAVRILILTNSFPDHSIVRNYIFCKSFMSELQSHIGPNTDVPTGDIGVGGREIGYLFSKYKKIGNEFTGVLTGKYLSFDGGMLRPEATCYGLVYFTAEMLNTRSETFRGKTVAVSGSGNVAQFAREKIGSLRKDDANGSENVP